MLRKIPYAVANYEKLVGEGFYFVDKTRFIRELEDYQAPVMLRPRRFGKSLSMALMKMFQLWRLWRAKAGVSACAMDSGLFLFFFELSFLIGFAL